MAHNMDSINRPTSKVMQPPGGGSSDIFGTQSAPVATSNRKHYNSSNIFGDSEEPAKTASATKYPGGKTSNIFGSEPEPRVEPQKRPPGGATSNIFGTEEPVAPAKPLKSNTSSNIFGQQKVDEKEEEKAEKKVTSSIKLFAPPGGKSSITFG